MSDIYKIIFDAVYGLESVGEITEQQRDEVLNHYEFLEDFYYDAKELFDVYMKINKGD